MESWRAQPVVFWAFLVPGALWLFGFFLVPLALVWIMSFGERAGPVDIVITWTLDTHVPGPSIRSISVCSGNRSGSPPWRRRSRW